MALTQDLNVRASGSESRILLRPAVLMVRMKGDGFVDVEVDEGGSARTKESWRLM
jgi:hypothetical protein